LGGGVIRQEREKDDGCVCVRVLYECIEKVGGKDYSGADYQKKVKRGIGVGMQR
jgi:hypothetical protein